MKNRIALILATFFALAGVSFGQGTLMVNTSTGAITAPVSAATFRSGNLIQTLDADLTSWAAITRGTGFDAASAIAVGSAGGFFALGTGNTLTAGTIELGSNGTDTTISRSAAGVAAIEGHDVLTTDGTQAVSNKTVASFELGAGQTDTTVTRSAAGTMAIEGVDVLTTGNTKTVTGKTISDSTNSIGDANTYVHDLATVPNQSGGWSEYYVTGSDFTTSSTTAVDITGMVSGTLTNSAVYEFEVVCRIVNAADTAGVKVGYHGGGTGTAATVFSNNMFNSNSVTAVSTGGINAIDTLSPAFLVYSGGEGMWISRGHFTAMSTGTATMSVQIAKVTSGTLTVRKGSKLKIRKLQQ